MRGSTPGSQKAFSMCRFVIPYQKELCRGIIASKVAERMGAGRCVSVPTATDAVPCSGIVLLHYCGVKQPCLDGKHYPLVNGCQQSR